MFLSLNFEKKLISSEKIISKFILYLSRSFLKLSSALLIHHFWASRLLSKYSLLNMYTAVTLLWFKLAFTKAELSSIRRSSLIQTKALLLIILNSLHLSLIIFGTKLYQHLLRIQLTTHLIYYLN